MPNECPGYDIKHSDGKAPVILELWRMQSTSSVPSLPDPLWARVVAPDRVLSIGQIELFGYLNWVQTNDMQNWLVWNRTNHLTVCKQMTDV